MLQLNLLQHFTLSVFYNGLYFGRWSWIMSSVKVFKCLLMWTCNLSVSGHCSGSGMWARALLQRDDHLFLLIKLRWCSYNSCVYWVPKLSAFLTCKCFSFLTQKPVTAAFPMHCSGRPLGMSKHLFICAYIWLVLCYWNFRMSRWAVTELKSSSAEN